MSIINTQPRQYKDKDLKTPKVVKYPLRANRKRGLGWLLPGRPDARSKAIPHTSSYFSQSKSVEESTGSGRSSPDEGERPPNIPPRDPPAPPVPPRDVFLPTNPDPSAYARMQYGGINFDVAMTPGTALMENKSKFEFNEMLGIQQFPQSYYEAISQERSINEKVNKLSISAAKENEGNHSSVPPPIPVRDDRLPHGVSKAEKVDFYGNSRSKIPQILKQRFPSPPPASPEQRFRQKQNMFQFPARVEQRSSRQMAPPPVPARDDVIEGKSRAWQVREAVNPTRTLSSSPQQSPFSSSPVQRPSLRNLSSSPHNGHFFNINSALSSSPRQGNFFPPNQPTRQAPVPPQRGSEGSDGYIRPLIGPSRSEDEVPPPVPPRIPTRKQSRPQQ